MKSFITAAGLMASIVGFSTLGATGVSAQSFRLCEGEYQEASKGRCPQSEPYAYCYTAEAEAARICRAHGSTGKPLMVSMRSVGGNKCGYTSWTVTCQ
uniref:hypothetical protein n=1 Tax=Methylobacterium sp. B34 TaxID=95563 RepID=UPI0003469845|nr:hypothetical protein [Methylobacterium sp. B34]